MTTASTQEGPLASGSLFRWQIPEQWNGTLLLYSRGMPLPEGQPPWSVDESPFAALLDEGYAIAGTGGKGFWPLEEIFANQNELLDTFERLVEPPKETIAWGFSIGGIATAGLVQVMPDRLSGAMPLCGNLAGAVGVHNLELDMSFVIKTLLASDSELQVVNISAPDDNLDLATSIVERAQGTSEGRARLALSAAVGNIPGWHDSSAPEPAADDFAGQQEQQYHLHRDVSTLVLFGVRSQVERRAGGNPSWNTGVDYRTRLASSINTAQVHGLYAAANLDLDADLSTLDRAERIEADPAAVSYLERHISFSGDLQDTPVLALHTSGDGLVTPDNEQAYADVVGRAGNEHLLRQLYLRRGGHCSHSSAEVIVTLGALVERIETGEWPDLDPDQLNTAAAALASELRATRDGQLADPSFFSFTPPAFPRPYDLASEAAAGTG